MAEHVDAALKHDLWVKINLYFEWMCKNLDEQYSLHVFMLIFLVASRQELI